MKQTTINKRLHELLAQETSELHVSKQGLFGVAKKAPDHMLELHTYLNQEKQAPNAYVLHVRPREQPTFYQQANTLEINPTHVQTLHPRTQEVMYQQAMLLQTATSKGFSLQQKSQLKLFPTRNASILYIPTSSILEQRLNKNIPQKTSLDARKLTEELYQELNGMI